jgi:hypothetical protein
VQLTKPADHPSINPRQRWTEPSQTSTQSVPNLQTSSSHGLTHSSKPPQPMSPHHHN